MKNLNLDAYGVAELKELSYSEMHTMEGGSLWSDACSIYNDIIKPAAIAAWNDFVDGWNSVTCGCS